ncbi:hypothetical protein [Kribbella sindirgiensis]|uniref:Uncharacterized protein n=1 Tax=Kribbella sindirgiensis TaxID=1124744 RepID=A0A4R0IRB1_9ACTN|nr:hypothetical protein [Kribbella sindirgiensis]TCC34934.1 hypothetical protein E0H50_13670 [Kribbella sindirgiensis]
MSWEALRHFVGRTVDRIDYLVSAGDGSTGIWDRQLCHEVDHGVQLSMNDGAVLRLSWEMSGLDEFLTTDSAALNESIAHGRIRAVDVSSVQPWPSAVGASIVRAGVALHAPGEGDTQMPWAARLELSTGFVVAVALGEVHQDAPRYLPESVVVLFRRAAAEAYQPEAGGSTAWGVDV